MKVRQKIFLILLISPLVFFMIASSGDKPSNPGRDNESKLTAKTSLEDFDIFSLGIEGEAFDMVSDNNNTIHIIL